MTEGQSVVLVYHYTTPAGYGRDDYTHEFVRACGGEGDGTDIYLGRIDEAIRYESSKQALTALLSAVYSYMKKEGHVTVPAWANHFYLGIIQDTDGGPELVGVL